MSKYQKIDKIDGIYIFQSYEKPLRTKIYDLEKENEVLRKALELACDDVGTVKDYYCYIDQAKKEMEE